MMIVQRTNDHLHNKPNIIQVEKYTQFIVNTKNQDIKIKMKWYDCQ